MEEHRERISAATSAVTLGDLQARVADLQTDSAPVQLRAVKSPAKFGGWGILAAAFVVSVLLGVGIGWGLYGNTRSPLDFTTDPRAKPDRVAAVVLTLPRSCIRSAGLPACWSKRAKGSETPWVSGW